MTGVLTCKFKVKRQCWQILSRVLFIYYLWDGIYIVFHEKQLFTLKHRKFDLITIKLLHLSLKNKHHNYILNLSTTSVWHFEWPGCNQLSLNKMVNSKVWQLFLQSLESGEISPLNSLFLNLRFHNQIFFSLTTRYYCPMLSFSRTCLIWQRIEVPK